MWRDRMKHVASSLLLASAFISTAAAAQTVTFVTDNLGYGTNVPATANFASMTITKDAGDLDVTVTATGLDLFGAGASLSSIVFVVPDGSSTGPISDVGGGSSVTLLAGGGPGFPITSLPGEIISRIDFSQTADLLTNGESVSFKWLGPFSVSSIVFVANVDGFDSSGAPVLAGYSMDALPLTTVPETSPSFLLVAGLAVIGFLARRRA
jgi:hypothetical protein